MQTIFDWMTVAVFAAVTVLFLQRSIGPARADDSVLRYVPPVMMCAVANWLGNAGRGGWASFLIMAAVVYFLLILRPGRRSGQKDG